MKIWNNKIWRAVTALVSADAFSFLLAALFSILVGRISGADALGEFSIAFVIATIIRTVIEGGYEYSIPRGGAGNYQKLPALSALALKYKFNIWLITFPIGIGIGLTMAHSWSFIILLVWNIVWSIGSVYRANLRAIGKIPLISKLETKANVVLYGLCIAALYIAPAVSWYLLLFLIIEIPKTIILRNHVSKELQTEFPILADIRLNFIEAFGQLKTQFMLVVFNLCTVLMYRMPLIVVSSLGGALGAGHYSAAMRFLTILRVIPGAILSVLLPGLSKEKDDTAIFKLTLIQTGIIGLIISAGLFFSAELIMQLTYKFMIATPILKILAWTFLPVSINSVLEAYLLAKHKEKQINLSMLAAAVIIGIGSIIGMNNNNILIPAYSALIGEWLLFIFYIFSLRKVENFVMNS